MSNNTKTTDTTSTISTDRLVDYSHAWNAVGMAGLAKAAGLNIRAAKPPVLLASGIQIIASWSGEKAKVCLYKRHDNKLAVSVRFLKSGKKCSALLDQIDVQPWRTVSEVCELTAKHGYLRLRQPIHDVKKAEATMGNSEETSEQMTLEAQSEQPEIAAAI